MHWQCVWCSPSSASIFCLFVSAVRIKINKETAINNKRYTVSIILQQQVSGFKSDIFYKLYIWGAFYRLCFFSSFFSVNISLEKDFLNVLFSVSIYSICENSKHFFFNCLACHIYSAGYFHFFSLYIFRKKACLSFLMHITFCIFIQLFYLF